MVVGVGWDPRIHTVRTGTWERTWETMRCLQIPPRIIGRKTLEGEHGKAVAQGPTARYPILQVSTEAGEVFVLSKGREREDTW